MTEQKLVIIPKLNKQILKIHITSMEDSSHLSNKFSEKAGEAIKIKQQKLASEGRLAKDPQVEYLNSMHKTASGKCGIPAASFKQAIVAACRFAGKEINMTQARGAFFVMGNIIPFSKHTGPDLREDFPVNPITKGRDWRIRAEHKSWELELKILYNANFISPEHIINLINHAGFHCGIGDWRPNSPKNPGNHGMFDVKLN